MLSNSSRAPHCPTALVFGCVVFCFVCVCCFVCGLCFWFFLVPCFCGLPTTNGQLNGLCKGPHSLSFAAFLSNGLACFSQFISGKYKLVERPGESHEGVGRKKYFKFSLTGTSTIILYSFESPGETGLG